MDGEEEPQRKKPARKPGERGKKAPPKKITESYLHNSGLYYLQRFSSSSENFRRVMLRKVETSCRAHAEQSRDTCVKLVDALVEKFIRSGLLDDASYTSGSVASLRRRGESARAIEARLSAKGLPREKIRHALRTLEEDSGQDEFKAALHFARRRRIGPFRTAGREHNPEKEMAVFARGGYGYEIVNRILALSAEQAAEEYAQPGKS